MWPTLDDQIQKALALAAAERGIGFDDLVRWVLADWVIDNCDTATPNPEPTTSQMAMLSRMSAAAYGVLTCEHCLGKLRVSDVRNNSCPKCEAPVEA